MTVPNESSLTRRAVNRLLLARQLLLDRADVSIAEALEQLGGLQTQYAPSGYVGLWTRLAGFRRDALTAALEDRSVVQATLMRATIHLVSRREYWLFAVGVRQARRDWLLRVQGGDQAAMQERAERLRQALADGPRTVRELGGLADGFLGGLGVWLDLVRVPPSGTWERRRADRLALAEQWVGPCDVTAAEGMRHLVRAYLRGFGPSSWRDIGSWAGLPVADVKRGAQGLALSEHRDESGRPVVDLVGARSADPDVVAPVRFLPHWDAVLLVHARRSGILPEDHRSRVFSSRNPFSVGTYLLDGRVAGAWSVVDGRIALDPFEDLDRVARREVEHERAALERFHA
jgi:hypothetical protein